MTSFVPGFSFTSRSLVSTHVDFLQVSTGGSNFITKSRMLLTAPDPGERVMHQISPKGASVSFLEGNIQILCIFVYIVQVFIVYMDTSDTLAIPAFLLADDSQRDHQRLLMTFFAKKS